MNTNYVQNYIFKRDKGVRVNEEEVLKGNILTKVQKFEKKTNQNKKQNKTKNKRKKILPKIVYYVCKNGKLTLCQACYFNNSRCRQDSKQ